MPDAPQLAAVLWDMDGTLVDTEPYWIAAEYRLVESFGGTWSDEQAHALVGSDLLAAAATIKAEGPVPLEPEAIVDRLVAEVIAGVQEKTVWQPGARRLLAELTAAGIPCALVTMSYASLAGAVANQLPDGAFRTLVTGDAVTNGKPHPEPYLTAAARLGVDPTHCIALEDSPTGVASAEAAGCVTIGIPHVAAIEAAPGRIIVESLEDLSVSSLQALVQGRNPRAPSPR